MTEAIFRPGAAGLGRRLPLAALLLALGCASGPAVDETLHWILFADGTSLVTYEVAFPPIDPATAPDGDLDAAVVDRIDEARQLHLNGWDPWTRRFDRVGAADEQGGWIKEKGLLVSVRRQAWLDRPDDLVELMADTDLAIAWQPGDEVAELSILTGPSTRASAAQLEMLERRLDDWSVAAVAYLEEVSRFFAYLDHHEERSTALVETLFTSEAPDLTPGEELLIERLVEAFGRVFEAAERRPGEAWSLEELVRLAYDPFPASLTVEVAHDGVLESTGFVDAGRGSFEVPPIGLERALEQLERRWVEPPLLTTWVRIDQGLDPDFDAAAFAALPRVVAELPSNDEVVEGFARAVAPPREYRLRWIPRDSREDGETDAGGPAVSR